MDTQTKRESEAATAAPLFPPATAFLVRHAGMRAMAVCVVLTAILMQPSPCVAQGDEIIPNPQGPAQLRPIWLQGGVNEQQGVGDGVGGIGDINGDSLEDFGVRQEGGGLWKIYLGARDSLSVVPIQQFRSSGTLIHPVIGRFFGGAQRYFGLERDTRYPNYSVFAMLICPIQGGRIDTVPVTVVTPGSQGISDALAADIDEDGDDELILVQKCAECTANYWIYEGGQGFPGDVPSLIVRDTAFSASGNVVAAAGDLDGDGHVDIMGAGEFVGGDRLEIHWGDGTLNG